MYKCRHCGLEYLTDEAVMCPRCQAPKGKGNNYCPFCGTRIEEGMPQDVCMNCGVDMRRYGAIYGDKSKIVAGLLGIFLGAFGIHNFYLGKVKRAILQLAMTIFGWSCYIAAIISTIANNFMYFPKESILFLGFGFVFCVGLSLGVRIWTFIEAILILCGRIKTDGNGNLLR